MKFRAILAGLVVVGATVILAGSGNATFPNKNGRIAFIQTVESLMGAVGDIFTVNPDGSGVRRVTSFHSTTVGAGNEAWSPDGKRLVFELFDKKNITGQLWLVNADGSGLHKLLSESSFLETTPSFSPDGSQIVFSRCGATNCAIYRIQADGTGLTAITHFNFNPDVNDYFPAYSPDGQTIAFGSFTRNGVISAVYLMNADGSNIRELTPPALEGGIPDWSPNGNKILFSTNSESAFNGAGLDEEMWTIDLDGTEPARLTDNNRHLHGYFQGFHDVGGTWSPQGDAIVFERDAPDFSNSAIYIMNADGSGERQIFQGPAKKPIQPPVTSLRRGPGDLVHRRLVATPAIFPQWGPAPK